LITLYCPKLLILGGGRIWTSVTYRFSERATLAAGWWFYDVSLTRNFIQRVFQLLLPYNIQHKNKKAATLKIVDTFQDQIKKNGSDARIKMYGDIPLAAGWWSWLLK